MRVNVISKTETSKLIDVLRSSWPSESIPRIKTLKVYEAGKNKYLLTAEKFIAAKVENNYVPVVGDND